MKRMAWAVLLGGMCIAVSGLAQRRQAVGRGSSGAGAMAPPAAPPSPGFPPPGTAPPSPGFNPPGTNPPPPGFSPPQETPRRPNPPGFVTPPGAPLPSPPGNTVPPPGAMPSPPDNGTTPGTTAPARTTSATELRAAQEAYGAEFSSSGALGAARPRGARPARPGVTRPTIRTQANTPRTLMSAATTKALV